MFDHFCLIKLIFLKSDKFLANLNSHNEKQIVKSCFFAFDYESLEIKSVKEGILSYNTTDKRIIFGFYDPNSQSNYPGWPLRNFLALLSLKW
jgi:hypothetical protein